MRRRVASPEAETVSYCPVRISWTASSEVPNVLMLTLQPEVFSQSVTQSTVLSLLPSSTYPGHASTLTDPSGVPSLASGFSGGGTKAPVLPAVVVAVPPHPDRASAVTALSATALARVVLRTCFSLVEGVQEPEAAAESSSGSLAPGINTSGTFTTCSSRQARRIM